MKLEEALPLELIRAHTKSDDDFRVSDEMLALYRRAALEAAEKWTGQTWSGQQMITEILPPPSAPPRWSGAVILRLKRAVNDSYVMLRGGMLAAPMRLSCASGSRKIAVPAMFFPQALSCCAPCGAAAENPLKVFYRAGAACPDEIPAGIIMGCLKYIAWQIGNPGDVLVKVMDATAMIKGGGTNSAVLASGAAEEWRPYRL